MRNIPELNDRILSWVDVDALVDDCNCLSILMVISKEFGIKRYANITVDIVQDWLMGLPSVLTIPYMNSDQNEIMARLGLEWTNEDFWYYCAIVARSISVYLLNDAFVARLNIDLVIDCLTNSR